MLSYSCTMIWCRCLGCISYAGISSWLKVQFPSSKYLPCQLLWESSNGAYKANRSWLSYPAEFVSTHPWGTWILEKVNANRSDSLSWWSLSPLPSTSTPLAPLSCSFSRSPLILIALTPTTWSSCPSLRSSSTISWWSASSLWVLVLKHHLLRRSCHYHNPVPGFITFITFATFDPLETPIDLVPPLFRPPVAPLNFFLGLTLESLSLSSSDEESLSFAARFFTPPPKFFTPFPPFVR